jgi:hypothetical protein
MSSATENVTDSLLSSLNGWKPNETKGGKGKAAAGRGGLFTPESTPDPDTARNEADKRRQEEVKQAERDDGREFATTKAQPPEVDEDEAQYDGSAGEQDDMIKEVLKCGKDDHRKILRVKESYDDAYKEESDIIDAVYERGMKVHPKYNKHKDAEKAFRSKSILRPR